MKFFEELYVRALTEISKDEKYLEHVKIRNKKIGEIMEKFNIEITAENYVEFANFASDLEEGVHYEYEYAWDKIILYIVEKLLHKICDE